jgi:hypothetical protein
MTTSIPLLKTIEITLSRTGVAELAFNRPARYNALSPLAYRVNIHEIHQLKGFIEANGSFLFWFSIGLVRGYSMGCKV